MPSEHALLHSIDAIVFDVIGTLVDEDEAFRDVAEQLAAATDVSDPAPLCHSWVRSLDHRMNAIIAGDAPWRPHRELVMAAAEDALGGFGVPMPDARAALVSDVDERYRAWPDVAVATAALRRHHLIVGLSNGDLSSLARLSHRNHISWDIPLSTAAVRTFKPDAAAYEYAIDAVRLDPTRTLFVAAHPWDLRAAAAHGFRTGLLRRPGSDEPRPSDRFDVEVRDLHELAAQTQ